MKVKTCEEYVLSRLEETENRLEETKRKLVECEEARDIAVSSFNQSADAIDYMRDLIKKSVHIKKAYNSDAYYMDISVWNSYDKDLFEQIVKVFGLELPKDEENKDD